MPGPGHEYGEAKAEATAHVSFDQVRRTDRDAREPVPSEPREGLLEMLADGLGVRQTDQRLLDPVALPEVIGGRDFAVLLDQQRQRQFEQFHRPNARRRFFFDQRNRQVQLFLLQQALQFGLVALPQPDLQIWIAFAHILEQSRQVVAQHDRRGADAYLALFAALQFARDGIEIREERADKTIELFPGGRQREGPALEQGYAQEFFELRDLAADGRLLNSLSGSAHRTSDAAVSRDVIKEFEMGNVHQASLHHFKRCLVKFYQLAPAGAAVS